MSVEFIIILFLGIFWWICIYSSIRSSIKNDLNHYDKKYEPIWSGYLLPIGLFAGYIVDLIGNGFQESFFSLVNNCINLVVVISIYYLFVFLFLKLFRKYLQPIVVSSIWMLPNLLYFFVMYQNNLTGKNGYVYIVESSAILLYLLIGAWILGFVFIIFYKMIEHFHYRKNILENAKEITDSNILNMFQLELENIKYKKDIQFMKSNQIKTPLTIGIRNQVLILPDMNYTEEELKLILRHEMIHIGRQDVLIKFHLIFCNALCWFNPLMWLANKKCSEDIELSCDASVLSNEELDSRKNYARLILKNANSEKGFTTCLSSNAKSLQCRLRNIIEPKKKKTGGVILLILVFLLVVSWGNISIAVKGYHGFETIFKSKDVELTQINPINAEYKNQIYSFENEDKIIDYFSNLEISKLPRTSIIDKDIDKGLWLYFTHDSGMIRTMIYDHYIEVDIDYVDAGNEYYYVKEGIDWEYLDELMIEYPSLKLSLFMDGVDFGDHLWPELKQASVNNQLIYQSNTEFFDDEYRKYIPTEFEIEFYDEVISDIEVIEKTVDGNITYKISKDELPLIEIPDKNVRYTIKATVNKDNQVYDVEYEFNLDVD